MKSIENRLSALERVNDDESALVIADPGRATRDSAREKAQAKHPRRKILFRLPAPGVADPNDFI